MTEAPTDSDGSFSSTSLRSRPPGQTSARLLTDCLRRIMVVEEEIVELQLLVQRQRETTEALRVRLRDTLALMRATLKSLRKDVSRIDDSLRMLYVLVQGINLNVSQLRDRVGLPWSTERLLVIRNL